MISMPLCSEHQFPRSERKDHTRDNFSVYLIDIINALEMFELC